MSRVLVYRYECPGHDRQPTLDLGRQPATQAPVTGFEPVTSYCAEYSNFTSQEPPMSLKCSSFRHWSGDALPCQCDVGYSRNGDICEGKKALPSPRSTDGTTENPTVRERNPAAEGSSGGPPIAILAGVAAVIVVFLFLVLVVVGLIIAVVRKKRKSKLDDPDTTENVAYETIATLPVIPTAHNPAYETCRF